MNLSDFWKRFRLGEEIHISGTFIYNGFRRLAKKQAIPKNPSSRISKLRCMICNYIGRPNWHPWYAAFEPMCMPKPEAALFLDAIALVIPLSRP